MSKEKQKIYWKMYQDKDSTGYNFLVMSEAEMKTQVNLFWMNGDFEDTSVLPPVFEPVLMTESEFKKLPEFDGY